MYQYSFERNNYHELTKLYRKLEMDHFGRDIEGRETIFVNNFIPILNNDVEYNFPKKLANTTNEQKQELLSLQTIYARNDIAIRGFRYLIK